MVDLSQCYLHKLGDAERGLLAELRGLVPSLVEKAREASEDAKKTERLTIWGVDLEKESEASDIILLKYLRAEELNLDKAATRIVDTLVFRADCKIDGLREAVLPGCYQGHDVISGLDVEGRPVMISRFGKMDLEKVFGDIEAFVRYRAKLMEEAMAQLSFKKGEPEDLTQVHDYSGVPLIFQTSQVKDAVSAVTKVFSDHYPETKGKTIFVNFPTAFAKLFKAFSLFIPERTLKKFQILGENDHAQLFESIPADRVPEGLGGMHRDGALAGPCKQVQVRARCTEEVCLLKVEKTPCSIDWELRVCYWDVSYEVWFVADGTSDLVQKSDGLVQATDGVISGQYVAKTAGELRCHFINNGAWFKSRLCLARAQVHM
ncbi:PATL3 [Symbiodinium natans]|uniref:PATL3 protein n=1 Tax=Symbiodinium natans TaxID=878477 RepID=A0A812RM62_9DINO|nr:PATL3 [Symbiodinium natans]